MRNPRSDDNARDLVRAAVEANLGPAPMPSTLAALGVSAPALRTATLEAAR